MRSLKVLCACLFMAGCSNTSNTQNAPKPKPTIESVGELTEVSEQERVLLRSTMQRLSQSIRAQPSNNRYELFWDESTNQKIIYDRVSQLVTVGAGGSSWAEYYPVTDEAIHAVADAQETPVGLTRHGARQKMKISREDLGLPPARPRSSTTAPR